MTDLARQRLQSIHEVHYDEVLAYCARRVGATDGEDAAAEVFAIAWRRIDDVEADVARAWLYGIARRVVANRRRSVRRRSRLARKVAGMAPVAGAWPEELIVRRAEDEELLAAVDQLRPDDQEVLLLSAWEELTAPEIGRVLGITTGAAEQRLHRARRRLARLVPASDDTDEAQEGAP